MKVELKDYLARIGRRGGLKSRRRLDSEDAREMARSREIGRAYRDFHAQCFWSSPKTYRPGLKDAPWVVSQLRKYGGKAGWERAARLCR